MGYRLLASIWLAVLISTTVVYGQNELYIEQLQSVEAFKAPILQGVCASQTNYLAVVSRDKVLKLYDPISLLEKTVPANLAVPVDALTFSISGRTLVVGTGEGQVYVADLLTGGAIRNFSVQSQSIISLALQDEAILFSACSDKSVSVTDLTSGNTMGALPQFDDNITGIAIRPGIKQFAVSLSTGQVNTYAFAKFAPISNLTVATSKISKLCYSPDNKYLAAGSIDGSIYLWDAQTGTLKMKYTQKKSIYSISFDQKNRWLAVSAIDSTISFYDLATMSNIKTMVERDGFVTFSAFINDETLITGTSKGLLKRWKVASVPPDLVDPGIIVEQPSVITAPLKVLGSEYEITGLVYDDNELKEVTMNGLPVKLAVPLTSDAAKIPEGMKSAKRFSAVLKLDSVGLIPFEIKVSDKAKHSISKNGSIQRLSADESVEIQSPAFDFETEGLSVPVKFKTWFEIGSYSISVNMVDIVNGEVPEFKVVGDTITDDVPLVAGYNQIQLTINGKNGERFSKTIGVNRKASILTGIAVPSLAGGGGDGAKKQRVAGSGPQTWAVVVGVSEYKNPGIPSLKYADKDAESIANFLRRPEGGGIPNDHMKMLLNKDATLSNVRDALIMFLNQAIDMDLVMIYFAGHGMPEPAKPSNMYLLTHDSDPTALGTTAFPMWDIQTVLARYINAKRVVVFTDACHSGGISVNFATRGLGSSEQNLVNQYLADLSKTKEGIVVFTASAAGEVSQEFPEYGHGVFTYFMLEGMEGKADYNNDYTITINELMQYTEEQVKRKTRGAQNPTRSQTEYDKEMTISILPH
jgi:hypothetical protein